MKKGIIAILISLILILIGLNNVNASTLVTPVEEKVNSYFTITNTNEWILDYGKYYSRNIIADDDNIVNFYELTFNSSLPTNHDYIMFSLSFSQPLNYVLESSTQEDFMTCRTFTCQSYNSSNVCSQYKCLEWYTSGTHTNEEMNIFETNITEFNFNVALLLDNNETTSCSIQNNNIVCDLKKRQPKALRFYVNFKTLKHTSALITVSTNYRMYDTTNISNIINNQQQTNDILSGEQDYNKEASEEVNGEEEINDYTEKEEQLFSSLDFEGIGDNEIVINPNTSTFIWEIIDRLRGMNGKIVLLMTSILGLGIIKMVLNR